MTEDEFEIEYQKILDRAPEHMKPRLEGIQWQCDNIRRKYKGNHTMIMIQISKMMMESVKELQMAFKGELPTATKELETSVTYIHSKGEDKGDEI